MRRRCTRDAKSSLPLLSPARGWRRAPSLSGAHYCPIAGAAATGFEAWRLLHQRCCGVLQSEGRTWRVCDGWEVGWWWGEAGVRIGVGNTVRGCPKLIVSPGLVVGHSGRLIYPELFEGVEQQGRTPELTGLLSEARGEIAESHGSGPRVRGGCCVCGRVFERRVSGGACQELSGDMSTRELIMRLALGKRRRGVSLSGTEQADHQGLKGIDEVASYRTTARGNQTVVSVQEE